MKRLTRAISYFAVSFVWMLLLSPMLTLSALAAAGGTVLGASLRDLVLALTVIAAAGLTLMIVIAYRRFRRHNQ